MSSSRLYTYLPKDNTVLEEGLLSWLTHGQEKRAADVQFSKDNSTFTLPSGKTPSHAVSAWNAANPGRKITVDQLISANPGVRATSFRAGKPYAMPSGVVAKPAPAAQKVETKAGPVGFRQNNPLNLRSDGSTVWQGADGRQPAGNYLKFTSPVYGVRAASRTLYNYGKRHGINTVNGVLSRFAPKSDNNPNNANYSALIEKRTGIKPTQRIDLTNENTLQRLVPAMGEFEIGPKYWGTYSPSVVSNAVAMGIPVKTTQKITVN